MVSGIFVKILSITLSISYWDCFDIRYWHSF